MKDINIKRLLIPIIILTILLSCNNKKKRSKDNIKVLNVDPEVSIVQVVPELTEYIEFIKLQTCNRCQIVDINKCIYYKNKLFLADFKQNRIFVFNINGEFLYSIDKHGRGPSEIIELSDFIIDRDNEKVIVWDNGQNKKVKYTLNGQYISSVGNTLGCRNFVKLDNSKYALYTGLTSKYNLYILDNGKIKERYLPVKKHMRNLPIPFSMEYFFNNSDNTFSILPCFSDFVYVIENENITPKYRINFGDNHMPKDYLKKNISANNNMSWANSVNKFFYTKLPRTKYAYSTHNIKESKSYIYFRYIYKNRGYQVFISKESGNSKNIKKWTFDSNKKIMLPISIIDFNRKEFIGWFHTHSFLEDLNNLNKKEKQNLLEEYKEISNLYQIIKSSTLNDNPIIIKMKLKK